MQDYCKPGRKRIGEKKAGYVSVRAVGSKGVPSISLNLQK